MKEPTPSEDHLHVLVVDDEKLHAETVAEILERKGYRCTIATSGKEGAKKIEHEEFDLILTDLKMGDLDGLAILRKAKEFLPESEVMVVTGYGDVKTAVIALQEAPLRTTCSSRWIGTNCSPLSPSRPRICGEIARCATCANNSTSASVSKA